VRISQIEIKNLRAFENEKIILDDYTTLVGSNGAGKSTILYALNVFFRQVENMTSGTNYLEKEDFHLLDTTKPIEIIVTFINLSTEAQAEFSEYYHNNELVITVVADFDEESGHAVIKQYGKCLAINEFKSFFDAHKSGEKAESLKEKYKALREKHPNLPNETVKEKMYKALRDYEVANPGLCALVLTEGQFYGFNSGGNSLAKYVQWVYVPAVKDATKENTEIKNSAFGKLLLRSVRAKMSFDKEIDAIRQDVLERYEKLLAERQDVLEGLTQSLNARLSQWAHPDATLRLTWQQDLKRAIQIEDPIVRLVAKEGDFEGELARFGHGLQRSYLLALLQEAASNTDVSAPTMILGIEEPELYQHPPQAKHLANVLQNLSKSNTQVVVTTHSPHFVSGADFESVRMIRRIAQSKKSTIRQVSAKDIADRVNQVTGRASNQEMSELAKLHQILQPQLCEMFFTSRLVLVEGIEDLAYITYWMQLNNMVEKFRSYGCHIVPVNGKSNLIRPIIVAQKLEIPTFVVFDADGDEPNLQKRSKHETDNKALLTLVGGDATIPFPAVTTWGKNYLVWPDHISKTIASDIGEDPWNDIKNRVNVEFGNPGSFEKNTMHIASKLNLVHQRGHAPTSLNELCNLILDFAKVT
jgi:putative ATP-dependent endonuclease of the OLD family